MPMAKSYMRISDALLDRWALLRVRRRSHSCDKNGSKDKTRAKNTNSNHYLLFLRDVDRGFIWHPCCRFGRAGYQCRRVLPDEARIKSVKNIVVSACPTLAPSLRSRAL